MLLNKVHQGPASTDPSCKMHAPHSVSHIAICIPAVLSSIEESSRI
jgi:hypothetical protein